MKKGIKRDYPYRFRLICVSCSSNKPGFINRNINRVLGGNLLKGGLRK